MSYTSFEVFCHPKLFYAKGKCTSSFIYTISCITISHYDKRDSQSHITQFHAHNHKNSLFQFLSPSLRLKLAEIEKCCEKCHSPPKTNAKEVQWILQIVPTLQQNVKDLQESNNAVQALHDKKVRKSYFPSPSFHSHDPI